MWAKHLECISEKFHANGFPVAKDVCKHRKKNPAVLDTRPVSSRRFCELCTKLVTVRRKHIF